ncbi:hypothetical protein GOL69_04590 [Sinorhizobium medicae]|nr:hypothetical protein [Sinorhizobium medicae]
MLSDYQIGLIKGMLRRGDDQHHIAALFGINAGRVAEVANGMKDKPNGKERGREIIPAPQSDLPPPCPYFLNFVSERDIILDGLEAAIPAVADYVASNPTEAARDMQRRFHSAIAERKRELYKGRLR